MKKQAPEHASHLLAARLDHLESRLGREVDSHHHHHPHNWHHQGELEERLLGLERRLEEVKFPQIMKIDDDIDHHSASNNCRLAL